MFLTSLDTCLELYAHVGLTKIAYDGTKVDMNSQGIAAPAETAQLGVCEHACRRCASCSKVRVDCLRFERRCVTSCLFGVT